MKFSSLKEGNFFVYNWDNPNFPHDLFIKDKSEKDALNLKTGTREKFDPDESMLPVVFDMELVRKQKGEEVSKKERTNEETLAGILSPPDL